MGTKTEYYDFNLPADTDYADQTQFNENFEVLDTTLHNMQSQINSTAAGLKYKGAVNYYNDLPNDAEIGDAYTVLYAGSSGTVPDGTEYVWGELNGTAQWIDFSKDTYTKADVDALLAAKQALLNVNNKLDPAYINYDSTHAAVTEAQRAQISTNQNNILLINQLNGAHNLLDVIDIEKIKTLNPTATWNNRTMTIGNVDWTFNLDGSILVNGTSGSGGSYPVFDHMTLPIDKYVMSGGQPTVKFTAFTIGSDTGSGYLLNVTSQTTQPIEFLGNIGANVTVNNVIIKPMITTLAVDTMDDRFYPYAPSNAELYQMILDLRNQ